MFASGKTAAVASAANYIEDVFSTWLYTGNGSTQTITNGIDLAGKGGMVWLKARTSGGSSFTNNAIIDTARGANANGYYSIYPNLTEAQFSPTGSGDAVATAVSATGFTVGGNANVNYNTQTDVAWTFRKQPKFFDVVTYTGNGTNGRTVAHFLGSTPGCIIVKRTDASNGWAVYHRAMNASPQDYMMRLNATDGAFTTTPSRWNNTLPTSTEFTLSGNDEVNGSGATYVAYLFAHNAGGFGLTGTDNVISCGSFTTDGSGNSTVTLGYEPQWVVIKNTTSPENWFLNDIMRGMPAPPSGSGTNVNLFPNTSAAESIQGYDTSPTATGFAARTGNPSQTYIYIAIRRGPMKVPTSGTSVFYSAGFSDNSSSFSTGFVTDFAINKVTYYNPDAGLYTTGSNYMTPRLVGTNPLQTNSTAAEGGGTYPAGWDIQDGYKWASGSGYDIFGWAFARAPSFADVVCYTGTGSATTFSHNLGVAPELMIVKSRSAAGNNWIVYSQSIASGNVLFLNGTAGSTAGATSFNSTAPTASVFTVGTNSATNGSGATLVAYLFATCAGVSKVGSYTGTGSTQTIDCGFTGGARFVLIKRTNTTGAWYVYDSSRGIQSGNDPYLLWNDSAAAVTNTNYVDAAATGFQVIGSSLNTSGSTYIFLAIA